MSIFDHLRQHLDPRHFDPGAALHDIEHGVQDAAANAQHGIAQAAHSAEAYLRDVQHDAERGVRGVAQEVAGDLHKAGNALKSELSAEALSIGTAAAKGALKSAVKAVRAGKKHLDAIKASHPELINAVNLVEVRVGVSVVTCHYPDWYERAEELLGAFDAFGEKFRLTRTGVRGLIVATAPGTVDFDLEGEVFTNAVGARGGLSLPKELAVAVADEILEEMGVPEN